MRTAGIVFLVIGCLDLVCAILGLASDPQSGNVFANLLSGSIMFIILGGILIHVANKRKRNEDEKKEWNREM